MYMYINNTSRPRLHASMNQCAKYITLAFSALPLIVYFLQIARQFFSFNIHT